MDKKTVMHFHPPTSEELASSLYVTWAGRKKWKPDEYIGYKTVNIHVLVYVVSGTGCVTQGGSENIVLGEGAAFMVFPGQRFRFCADTNDPWEFYWFAFGGQGVPNLIRSMCLDEAHFIVRELSQRTESMAALLLEQVGEPSGSSIGMLGSLLNIFSEIEHAQALPRDKAEARRDIVPRAVRFIESYYFIHLDVDMLCRYVKYSRSYLSRLFNNELGVTIPEYINQVRINHAKKLFETTLLSVQEVSSSVGIIDSFYFSKTFKKIVGLSPNQYKKRFGLNARKAGLLEEPKPDADSFTDA